MLGRNRRVRLLVLAAFLTTVFLLYSRSDEQTIRGAKQYAEKTYQKAVDTTIGKPKPKPYNSPPNPDPISSTEPKKEDSLRVDFEAYSKLALAQETSTAADPYNTEVIANPNPMVAVVGEQPDIAPAPGKPAAPAAKAGESKEKQAPVQQEKGSSSEAFPERVGEGRLEVDVGAATGPAVFWAKFPENFPVSSTIKIPTASPKIMPRIQHSFKKTPGTTNADEQKLAAVKAAAQHAWDGYKTKAMGHDEIKPLSGKYANPFNGWGATLVDSLDTLWMMGMISDFELALDHVKQINFTTSPRPDIPVFETTIRYLGGLLGAYELSGRNYEVLLDKAVELGDMLYMAFDTPNRMPMTYYQWKPAFASQPHRASLRAIMAEIGSLSLEFTRLAQITSDPKYYDAIARVTDALEEWQKKTRVPGLWPTTLDASGCKDFAQSLRDGRQKGKDAEKERASTKGVSDRPAAKADAEAKGGASQADSKDKVAPGSSGAGAVSSGDKTPNAAGAANLGGPANLASTSPKGADSSNVEGSFKLEPATDKSKGSSSTYEDSSLDSKGFKDPYSHKGASSGTANLVKRAEGAGEIGMAREDAPYRPSPTGLTNTTLFHDELKPRKDEAETRANSQKTITDGEICTPQGLTSANELGSDFYTLGAAADSTYEYLPKMHLLLSGRTDQYKKMYIAAADAAIENLIYRPMIPDEKREILFAGSIDSRPESSKGGEIVLDFKPVATHLTCFAGGMFAMGGKLFDRPQDIEIGRMLTDGCVWAYNVTNTGIMPEVMTLSKCDDPQKCKWDQTKYWRDMDPMEQQHHRGDKPSSTPQAEGNPLLGQPHFPVETKVVASGLEPANTQAAMPGAVQGKDLPMQGKDVLGKRQYMDDARYGIQTAPAAAAQTDAYAANIGAGLPPAAGHLSPNVPAANLAAANAPTTTTKGSDAGPPTKVADDLSLAMLGRPQHLTHEQYVKKKIEDERLPAGVTNIYDKQYKLRPEAIESVLYMYRITGEQYWRDRGWEMWESVYKHTWAQYGAAGIDDVTKTAPEQKDVEESFWLAETVKYFYMLFDDPDRYSFDVWVFNTEAHFLRQNDGKVGVVS